MALIQSAKPPHVIAGDLDSISHESVLHCAKEWEYTLLTSDSDQYSTDFQKSVKWATLLHEHFSRSQEFITYAKEKWRSTSDGVQSFEVQEFSKLVPYLRSEIRRVSEGDGVKKNVVVLGGLGGRVDQGLGLLGEMAREEERAAGKIKFWLVSERSVSWILHPSISTASPNGIEKSLEDWHRIQLSPYQNASMRQKGDGGASHLFTPNIGIIPIFGPAEISTTGLEWDVTDWPTHMGGNVSTSNHLVEEHGIVKIWTTERVLFTVEMGEGLMG